MSEHTPGKLVVRGGYSIYTADDKTPVADTCLTNSVPDKDEANARRLVAAWNACDGFETDLLENIVMTGGTLKSRFALRTQEERESKAERDSLRAVNAELLEALKTYQRAGIGNSTDFMVQNIAYERGLAAIASARKQENPHG